MAKQIKKYKYLLLVVFVALAYLVMSQIFPKSLSRFPIYVIIFLLDLYLWKAFSKSICSQKEILKYSLVALYWMPLSLMIIMSLVSIFYSLPTNNTPLYTYISGIVLITYTAKMLASVIILISDIIRLSQHIWRFAESKRKKQIPVEKQNAISRSKFLKKISLATGGVVLSSMLIGRFKWVYDFKIHRHDVPLNRLPNTFDGFKIIQLSDLHLGSWTTDTPLLELVSMVNDLKPDAILFTGDLVNFSTREAYKYESILRKFKAKFGIFTVLGNHDYGDYVTWKTPEKKADNMRQLYEFYDNLGWKLLRNENAFIKKNKQKIAILGVENWGHNPRFPQLGDVKKASKGVDPEMVQILLSHDPSHWDKIVSKQYPDIDLTLSGHTHGFQFGIEIPGFRWSPAQYLYKYWAGLYKQNNQFLNVNRGTGFLGYPGRIGILPEITELILRKS